MNNRGFSLIETIIYLALFSVIIGGGMVGVYQIVDSNNKNLAATAMEQEANFLLRKINWALTGATDAIAPNSQTLNITKGGNSYLFDFNDKYLRLDGAELNNDTAPVESLSFVSAPADGAKPASITAKFTIKGHLFETTKHLRQ